MIVVSGASGMVGSQIVLALLEAGMGPVRGLYRSKSSLDSARQSWDFQGLGHRWDEVDWFRADLEDPTDVEAALEGADYAVHAAALVSFRKKDEHLMLRGTPLLAEHMVNVSAGVAPPRPRPRSSSRGR
ncbi:MAG: NAD-dependent epimerase/dehydratase family protein, partial [Schleiferiaceae bacterium]